MPLIKINDDTKKKLDSLKIHHRETYDDIVRRLIEFYEKSKRSG